MLLILPMGLMVWLGSNCDRFNITRWLAYYQDQKLTLAFILSLIATVLGFMIFNVNPASIFMGNTGSYALGGA